VKVKVACPYAERKAYALPKWLEVTKGYDRLLAIDDAEYAKKVAKMGVPVVAFEPVNPFRMGANAIYGPRFNEAWQAILDTIEGQGYDYILSLEIDVIPPPGVDILEVMLANKGREDFLCHGYPWRYPSKLGGNCYEFGCMLTTPEVIKKALSVGDPRSGIYGFTRWIDHFTHRDVDIVKLAHIGDIFDDRLDNRDPRRPGEGLAATA
jgi:hypothetical protein